MTRKQLSKSESHVYPGEFVTNSDIERIRHIFKKNKRQKPALNLIELPDLFKIEIFIPGVKREDFIIEIMDNVLTVKVLQNETIKCVGEVCTLKEFEAEGHLERKVILPKNVDAIFTNAEYKSGVLKLHVPKSNKEEKQKKTRIVVY